MSDINSLQGESDTSLFIQKIDYNKYCCGTKLVYMCNCTSDKSTSNKNKNTNQRNFISSKARVKQ